MAFGVTWMIVAIAGDLLDAWAINIATSAFTIAATILVVERIVRHEARERLRPRTELLFGSIGLNFRLFISAVTNDYASTHLATFRAIPADAQAMIEQWLADQEAEDETRLRFNGETLPMLMLDARRFLSALEGYRERDREVMDPDLVAAIDDLGSGFRTTQGVIQMYREHDAADRRGAERVALDSLMRDVRDFAAVLALYAPEWMKIPETVRSGSASLNRILRNRRI
jgi:hypothetical protein